MPALQRASVVNEHRFPTTLSSLEALISALASKHLEVPRNLQSTALAGKSPIVREIAFETIQRIDVP